MTRREPSPTAKRVVIGERHGMPRFHASMADAFPDVRFRTVEHHHAHTLRGALSRWVRSLINPKGSL